MPSIFRRPNPLKILKIVLGCCAAYAAASLLGLRHAASSVTITLLSIQDTRRSTFRLAATRCCAFLLALGIAFLVFRLLGYSLASLGVFLLLFAAGCQVFGLEGGLSMSTVLVLHFWTARAMPPASVVNELALMAIGIAAGIVTNLYMPRQTAQIRADQSHIDETIRQILRRLADAIAGGPAPDGSQFEELGSRLETARRRARAYMENSFNSDTRYFLEYIDLRRRQRDILAAIASNTQRLGAETPQAEAVAAYTRHIADSLHEYNNARTLLDELETVRRAFRESELPATREEFETRAVLVEIVYLIRRLLQCKKEFAESLTPGQIRRFWGEPPAGKS